MANRERGELRRILISCAIGMGLFGIGRTPVYAYDLGGPCSDSLAIVAPKFTFPESERSGNWDNAIEANRVGVRKGCSNVHRWYGLVDVLLRANRNSEAIEALEDMDIRGFEIKPRSYGGNRVARFLNLIGTEEFKKSIVGKRYQAKRDTIQRMLLELQEQLREMAASEKPPAHYISRNVCPFEGCMYREWPVQTDTKLVDKPGGEKVVAKAPKGTIVRGITGEVHVRPRPVGVIYDHPPFTKGDIFFLLDYRGEGHYNYWHAGAIRDASLYDVTRDCFNPGENCWTIDLGPSEHEYAWWVKIQNANGFVGWTDKTGNFNGVGAFGGPPESQRIEATRRINFKGFHIEMDLPSLISQYPSSNQWSWPRGGGYPLSAETTTEEFSNGLLNYTGSYHISVSSDDFRNGISHITFEIDSGSTQKISLSFRTPEALRPTMGSASCVSILESLEQKFGVLKKEDIPNLYGLKTWLDSNAELTFDCNENQIRINSRSKRKKTKRQKAPKKPPQVIPNPRSTVDDMPKSSTKKRKSASPATKKKERKAKGSLGTIRSALKLYSDGIKGLPSFNLDQLVPEFFSAVPVLDLPGHTPNNSSRVLGRVKDQADLRKQLEDSGKWLYIGDPNSPFSGSVYIDCTHTDSSGYHWNKY